MRGVVFALIWLATHGIGAAQADKVHRIGVLGASSSGLDLVRAVTLPELGKLGFAEGQNLVIEMRTGPPGHLPGLAQAVVAANPNAILALDGTSLAAARAETGTIPIVMFGADPVELGFAESLARPGSNVTGIAIFASELDAKRVELLHGALPSARTLAVLMDVSIAGAATRRRRISDVASQLGLKVVVIEAEATHAYEGAFDAMKAAGAEGLAIGASPQFSRDGAPLAELALDRQLATICQWREMAKQGCLLSYGPSRPELFRRTASFLGRILKGELASEVPIERPTKFELVINLNTAKTLGLTIPPTLLARADEVIE